jgi:hypothetical protein
MLSSCPGVPRFFTGVYNLDYNVILPAPLAKAFVDAKRCSDERTCPTC